MQDAQIGSGLRQQLARVIDQVHNDTQVGPIFWEPVDPIALGLADYLNIVDRPMCLMFLKNALQLN